MSVGWNREKLSGSRADQAISETPERAGDDTPGLEYGP